LPKQLRDVIELMTRPVSAAGSLAPGHILP
jgi:hypothetical protein